LEIVMRVSSLSALLAVPLVVLAVTVDVVESQEKPVRRVTYAGDYATAPPASLNALASSSQAILEGTVVSSRPLDLAEIDGGIVYDVVRTAYRLGDVRWIKRPAEAAPLEPVELILMGGLRLRGDTMTEYVDELFPAPVAGERYLLFLNRKSSVYVPATHGAESAFKVQGERITPVGRSNLSRQLAGMSRNALASSLGGGVQ
jgi:hypothetical protein